MDLNDILHKLQPLRPRQVEQWQATLQFADADVRSLLEKQIRIIAAEAFGKDFESKTVLSLPPPEKSKGAIELGHLIYDRERWSFGLTPGELLQNISIFGRSGAGKTNVVFHLLQQLSEKRIPFLFLDWKRTARHLAPHLKMSPVIFTPGRSLAPFAFNPLIVPPGVEIEVYQHYVIDLLAQSYTLGDGAKSVLHRAFTACYTESRSPSFSDVLSVIDATNTKGRETAWMQSARRACESVVASAQTVDPKLQIEQAKSLLKQSTILELDGMSTNAKKFMIPLLCYWIFSSQLANASREKLRFVILFEEAHHLLYRHERGATETLPEQLLRMGRELGIASIVVDQHPSLISTAALGNCYTTICLNLKDPSDLSKAAGLSLINDSDKRLFSRLPVGQGVVKLQDRFTDPFLVKFPLHPLKKGAVTDEMLAALNRGRTTWKSIRERLSVNSSMQRHSRVTATLLGEPAIHLLHDIATHPEDGVDSRYKRLKVSVAQGHRLKQQLLDAELVIAASVKVGRTYRVVLRLTNQTRRMMIERPGRDPQASFLHEYWKQTVAKEYEQKGFAVTIEAQRPKGGGNIDILARRESETVGIEIETGKSDVVANVKRDLLSGFERVIVVATSDEALRIVERQLGKAGLLLPGRVRLQLAGEEQSR